MNRTRRTLVALAATVAALLPTAPANAFAVTGVYTITVSNVTKSSAHLRCDFNINSGGYYVRFYMYRTSDQAYKHLGPSIYFGQGYHYLYTDPDTSGLQSGTQWTVWCQMLRAPTGPTSYKKSKNFSTLPSTNSRALGSGWG